MMSGGRAVAVLGVCLLLCGCGKIALLQKERQMELVARDWSMTIRASQVIPVYPLTQDLMPGDVFLVQVPVAEQSRRYRERGFLPTDLQVARLGSTKYAEFYKAYETPPSCDGELVLPRDWRAGPPSGSVAEHVSRIGASTDKSGAHKDAPATPAQLWRSFPRAGFPSYTFEVSNRGGLSAALPVQGIPVALSATGAAKAMGSVTIADAVSYGADARSLYEALRTHLQDSVQQDDLRPPPGQIWHLRVITRVFAAKRFDIVLTATSTWGGGIDAGAPKNVTDVEPPKPLALPPGFEDVPEVQAAVAADATQQAANRKAETEREKAVLSGQSLEGGLTIDSINERLKALEPAGDPEGTKNGVLGAAASVAPGVSLRATFASGRTVGFRETYAEPIVIGYHGFDVAIDSDGNVGPIVPTFAVLSESVAIPRPTKLTTQDQVYLALVNLLTEVEVVQPDSVAAVVMQASSHDAQLHQFYKAEFKAQKNAMGAWKDATRRWIDDMGEDFVPARRQRVREWLAGAVRESELTLEAKPVEE